MSYRQWIDDSLGREPEYGTHDNYPQFRDGLADAFEYMRVEAPDGADISTLSPFQDRDIEALRKLVLKARKPRERLTSAQSDNWWVRQLDALLEVTPATSSGQRISNVVLVMAEAWEDSFGEWPTSDAEDAPFYELFCALVPEGKELQPSYETVATVLADLNKRRAQKN